jgi:hypothetical protein
MVKTLSEIKWKNDSEIKALRTLFPHAEKFERKLHVLIVKEPILLAAYLLGFEDSYDLLHTHDERWFKKHKEICALGKALRGK